MLWFLAREVLRIRGTLSRTEQWEVMPDLFFYRDIEEAAKEEQVVAAEPTEQFQEPVQGDGEWDQSGTIAGQNSGGFVANEEWNPTDENWSKAPVPTESWANQTAPGSWGAV